MKKTFMFILVLIVLIGTIGCTKNYDYDGLWLCYALTDDNTTLSWHLGSDDLRGSNLLLSMTPENLYKYIRKDNYNLYGQSQFIIDFNEEKLCEETRLQLSQDVYPGNEKKYSTFSVKRHNGAVVSIELDGLTYWRLSDELIEKITTGKMTLSDFEKMFIK